MVRMYCKGMTDDFILGAYKRRHKINTPQSQICVRSLPWLVIGTSITSDDVKLVYQAPITLFSRMS